MTDYKRFGQPVSVKLQWWHKMLALALLLCTGIVPDEPVPVPMSAVTEKVDTRAAEKEIRDEQERIYVAYYPAVRRFNNNQPVAKQ